MSSPVKVVRVNGRAVDPDTPALRLDDPLARAGDGLIETMRARNHPVFRLDQHLERLHGSARALSMSGLPGDDRIRAELDAILAAAGPGDLQIRLAVSSAPTLWVEAQSTEPLPVEPRALTAITMPGSWRPELFTAQHKTSSRALWSWAERRARETGADTALLLDEQGRMGEATTASVFVRTPRAVLTAPVRGLLRGVGRGVMMELVPDVVERAATREEWETAEEIVLVSALRGVSAVTSVDGEPIGTGRPGPMARGQQAAYRLVVEAATGGPGLS